MGTGRPGLVAIMWRYHLLKLDALENGCLDDRASCGRAPIIRLVVVVSVSGQLCLARLGMLDFAPSVVSSVEVWWTARLISVSVAPVVWNRAHFAADLPAARSLEKLLVLGMV